MSKPVLFVSMRPLELSPDIEALYNAFNGPKLHLTQMFDDVESEISTGQYDLMVTDDFPTVTPGKCIMIWHGIQGGKYIGLDQPNHPFYDKSQADLITFIISPGEMFSQYLWNRCTGVPMERILPYGLPRTDDYAAARHIQFPVQKEKHYLFAPTFRDQGETPFPDIDWDYLDSMLNDDEVLAIKTHPWETQTCIDQLTGFKGNGHYKHIIRVSAATPSDGFLYNANVVITDYSSIMFDAYLLNKPVVLFEKTPGYTDTRGMYLQYPGDYCSFFAKDEQQLLANIRFRAAHPWLTDKEVSLIRQLAINCDGHACERIIDLIIHINGGDD